MQIKILYCEVYLPLHIAPFGTLVKYEFGALDLVPRPRLKNKLKINKGDLNKIHFWLSGNGNLLAIQIVHFFILLLFCLVIYVTSFVFYVT